MRGANDYSYAQTYSYGNNNSGGNYYQPPSRGVVGDMWRQPSITDNYYQQPSGAVFGDGTYGYTYNQYEQKQSRGTYPEIGIKENRGLHRRGYEKDYISSGNYYGTPTGGGYKGSMTGATNDIGTAMELLTNAALGGGTRASSRIGEVESPVNYYPTMHSTMDASKRYGSLSLAPRRPSSSSYVGEALSHRGKVCP